MSFPLKTISGLECCLDKLEDRVELIEGNGLSTAITDIVESTAEGTNAAGDPPTQAEFNALVTNFNTLVSDHNSLVVAFNEALQVLRDHNLLDT
jgi:hypothetical protein